MSCTALEIIGLGAFADCNFASLDLSSCANLTYIGDYAFSNNSVESLDLSACSALDFIGDHAFRSNSRTKISFSGCVKHIGVAAFSNNKINSINNKASDGIIYACNADNSIDSTYIVTYGGASKVITIPANVITIGNKAFVDNNISGSNLNNCLALKTIGDIAFAANSLDRVNFSSCTALDYVGKFAFAENYIDSIDLSSCLSLSFIGDYAFSRNSLKYLDINSCTSLSFIGNYAFVFNSLTNINIHSCTALIFIGKRAFDNNYCSEFILPFPNNRVYNIWQDDDGNLYGASDTVSTGKAYSILMPYTLTDSDVVVTNGFIDSCLYNAPHKYIIIPDTLGGQAIKGITGKDNGQGVFRNKGISFLELPGTLTFIGRYAFYGNTISTIDLSTCKALTTIGDYAFYSNKLISVDLTACNSLDTIGRYAFYGNELSKIDLSACSALIYIGARTFYGNHFTEFMLPMPNVIGSQFIYWLDEYSNENSDNILVDNLYTSYSAKFTGTSVGNKNVVFTISDGENPIVDAVVNLSGYGIAITDESGIATFTGLGLADNIHYTVSAVGYENTNGMVSVADADVNELITLNLITYNVNFKITDGANVITNASVSLSGYGTATTDALGIVSFSGVVPADSIYYIVSADGYVTIEGNISVVDADVVESLTLNLSITDISETDNYTIKVYPNPAVGTISIALSDDNEITNFELYNIMGQKQKIDIIEKSQNNIAFNIANLKRSMNFLKMLKPYGSFSKIIIKI